MTLASERDPAGEIRQGALSAANGDTTKAFFLLSTRTAKLLDGANVKQGELEACQRANERFKDYYIGDERGWLRKSWDSDIVKVGIFIGGIWVGTRIVYSVN